MGKLVDCLVRNEWICDVRTRKLGVRLFGGDDFFSASLHHRGKLDPFDDAGEIISNDDVV